MRKIKKLTFLAVLASISFITQTFEVSHWEWLAPPVLAAYSGCDDSRCMSI